MLLRVAVGEVLRDERQAQGATLREIAGRGRVALGYLSEVERGRKEVSSELLASVAAALDVPVCVLLRRAAERLDPTAPPAPRPAGRIHRGSPLPVQAA